MALYGWCGWVSCQLPYVLNPNAPDSALSGRVIGESTIFLVRFHWIFMAMKNYYGGKAF